VFTTLHLKNFRGFTDLELKGLRRVNLIVGKNNSGKTSLLEGIAILSDPSRLEPDLPGLLRARVGNVEQRYYRWIVKDGTQDKAFLKGEGQSGKSAVYFTSEGKAHVPLAEHDMVCDNAALKASKLRGPKTLCRVVSVQAREPNELVKLFARAVKRRRGEETIERLIEAVDDRIKKIRVEPGEDGNHLMVDLGLSEMIPLTQVGQGINRLVAMFSEIVGEQPGVCLIDEIENGIHHSLLQQIWTGIAASAAEMDVQVFATTHSQECVQAAHDAFAARTSYDFSIIQLFRLEDGKQGRVLDRKHIEAALAGDIDLR
jgi:predicted ATPase